MGKKDLDSDGDTINFALQRKVSASKKTPDSLRHG